MCGIFGIYQSRNKSEEIIRKKLAKCKNLLNHRGPDDNGIKKFNTPFGALFFGHTRLSIIDLSFKGHQPMESEDGRFQMVFNGEIYNYRELKNELERLGYRFQSESDSEVLLKAWIHWNENCIQKLEGMFAFSIFDKEMNCLYLVRDSVGIKPLFYSIDEKNCFVSFASEIQALTTLQLNKPKLNLKKTYDYFIFSARNEFEDTFFENIFYLPPAHYMKVELREENLIKNVSKWWSPSINNDFDQSYSVAKSQLREKFLSSVDMHLRSDVPVGASLSGGLDSSSIVCAMRYLKPNMDIHTFTYCASDYGINESNWADIVNENTKAINHRVTIKSNLIEQDIKNLIFALGEPFGGLSIYSQYLVHKAAKQSGIKVMMDGQGADEILGGYGGFPEHRIKSLMDEKKFISSIKFLYNWKKWPGRSSNSELLKIILKSFLSPKTINSLRASFDFKLVPWINHRYFQNKINSSIENYFSNSVSKNSYKRKLVSQLREEISSGSLTRLLRYADRTSMLNSIEARVPFLSRDLIEFLFKLPEDFLVSNDGRTKSVFRSAMRGIVPSEILDRKDKIGFAVPEKFLLSKIDIKDWIRPAKDIPFIHFEDLEKDLYNSIKNKKKYDSRIWRILNFCKWYEIYQPEI